jgi:death on curing protein
MNEPEWLTKETTLEIHAEVISVSGGSHGLRDEGLLESALSRPQNVFAYEDVTIFDLAASYAEARAHNHPFVDGNKRTAMTAADVFLEINNYEMNADQKQIADLMVDLAEKKISRDEVAVFFEKKCKRH